MGLAGILARIDERLAATGYTDNRASQLSGHPDAIRNMRRALERGGVGPSPKLLGDLARVLGVSTAWLMGEPEGSDELPGLNVLRHRRVALLRELESLDQSITLLEESIPAHTEDRRQKKR